ncbi:MAG: alanine--glyoxylate aminotransferase family protein [Planctomycetes bacterium]|nr:alanine--glyoxylate aminotransferase family protein [Planctomycetota bacterium]
MHDQPHDLLFLPGPVEVDPELRAILAEPMVGHRSQRFKAELLRVLGRLQELFATRAHTLLENAPATALMEAGIRNLVARRVLVTTCGAFSERWATIARSCGREVETLAVPWGQAVTPEALRAALRARGPFEAVTITHNETSTGVIQPLRELAAAVRETAPETLVLVDVVTSLAGAELPFDAWGLDLAFAGTQKALALPPGLVVYALSDRALRRSAEVPDRGFLLDFVRAREGLAKGETLATPCVPLVFALGRQLDRILAEGLLPRAARHAALQARVAAWAARHGFTFFPEQAAWRSPTVSCLRASGRDVPALLQKARAAGFVLDGGYGPLKGQTFRIGHMGDHGVARVDALLAAIP